MFFMNSQIRHLAQYFNLPAVDLGALKNILKHPSITPEMFYEEVERSYPQGMQYLRQQMDYVATLLGVHHTDTDRIEAVAAQLLKWVTSYFPTDTDSWGMIAHACTLTHTQISIHPALRKRATQVWIEAGCSWQHIHGLAYRELLMNIIRADYYDKPVHREWIHKARQFPQMNRDELLHSSRSIRITFDASYVPRKKNACVAVVATNEYGFRWIQQYRIDHTERHNFPEPVKRTSFDSQYVESLACLKACETAMGLPCDEIAGDNSGIVIEVTKYLSGDFHRLTDHWHPLKEVMNKVKWHSRKHNKVADYWTR